MAKYHMVTHQAHELYYDIDSGQTTVDWGTPGMITEANCNGEVPITGNSGSTCDANNGVSIGFSGTFTLKNSIILKGISVGDIPIPGLEDMGVGIDFELEYAGTSNIASTSSETVYTPDTWGNVDMGSLYEVHKGRSTDWGVRGFTGESVSDYDEPKSPGYNLRIHQPLNTNVPYPGH
jgi:hypothetical protein